MTSTGDREDVRIEFDFDSHDSRRERNWGLALFLLALTVGWFFMVFDSPASIGRRVAQILLGVFLGAVSLLMLVPANDSNRTLAYFDFFGRINPEALARKRGPLAIAARMLEQNRATLKGEFTVVTAAGRDWDRFPKGRGDRLAPRYVALASNREPLALFFYWGQPFPFNPSILIHEYHYSLYGIWEDGGERYYYPQLRVAGSDGRLKRLGEVAYPGGEGLRRALGLEHGPERVRMRFWLHQVTPENVQRAIDQFVAGTREANGPTPGAEH